MAWLAFFLQLLLMFIGVLLMGIILIQRGRGGGLAGAFGGMGGQSAFGAKAGDFFTWLTVGFATVWVIVAGISGCVARKSDEQHSSFFRSEESNTPDLVPGNAVPDESPESTSTLPADPLPPLEEIQNGDAAFPPPGSNDPPAPAETEAAPADAATETPAAEASTPATEEAAPAETETETAPATEPEASAPAPSAEGAASDENRPE